MVETFINGLYFILAGLIGLFSSYLMLKYYIFSDKEKRNKFRDLFAYIHVGIALYTLSLCFIIFQVKLTHLEFFDIVTFILSFVVMLTWWLISKKKLTKNIFAYCTIFLLALCIYIGIFIIPAFY